RPQRASRAAARAARGCARAARRAAGHPARGIAACPGAGCGNPRAGPGRRQDRVPVGYAPTITMDHAHDFESSADALPVRLEHFEGPLDLLVHLIRRNEVNIYDIPIALITTQYLETIALMEELDLDVAGEFLVMAATLI